MKTVTVTNFAGKTLVYEVIGTKQIGTRKYHVCLTSVGVQVLIPA